MDAFVFKPAGISKSDALKIGDIAGESLFDPAAVWGTDGASMTGMHVDPVIPGASGFEDRSLGFEDPSFGLNDPFFG